MEHFLLTDFPFEIICKIFDNLFLSHLYQLNLTKNKQLHYFIYQYLHNECIFRNAIGLKRRWWKFHKMLGSEVVNDQGHDFTIKQIPKMTYDKLSYYRFTKFSSETGLVVFYNANYLYIVSTFGSGLFVGCKNVNFHTNHIIPTDKSIKFVFHDNMLSLNLIVEMKPTGTVVSCDTRTPNPESNSYPFECCKICFPIVVNIFSRYISHPRYGETSIQVQDFGSSCLQFYDPSTGKVLDMVDLRCHQNIYNDARYFDVKQFSKNSVLLWIHRNLFYKYHLITRKITPITAQKCLLTDFSDSTLHRVTDKDQKFKIIKFDKTWYKFVSTKTKNSKKIQMIALNKQKDNLMKIIPETKFLVFCPAEKRFCSTQCIQYLFNGSR